MTGTDGSCCTAAPPTWGTSPASAAVRLLVREVRRHPGVTDGVFFCATATGSTEVARLGAVGGRNRTSSAAADDTDDLRDYGSTRLPAACHHHGRALAAQRDR